MKAKKLRVGITASDDPLARQVREAIAEEGVEVSRFVELGEPAEEGHLREEEGEIAIVQAPRRETIADLDVLILAGSAADAPARRLAEADGVPVIDAAAQSPAALGIAALLAALPAPPLEADVTIVLPAADRGERAIEELFTQTGDALNFRPTSAPVFGARLAFNLLRDGETSRREAETREELSRSWPKTAFDVICLRAALFHGYGAAVRFLFPTDRDAQEAERALARSAALSIGRSDGHAAADRAVEGSAVLADPLRRAGRRVSLWLAYDGLALAARRVAASVRALP